MRRILKLSMFCLLAGAVSACKPDEVITTENIPTAGVRFIHAVPDTMNLDFRFIDLVESNAHFRIPFRNNVVTAGGVPASTQAQYKNARAGARQYRVFLNDTLIANASTVVFEGTLNLTAGVNYTVIVWGYANPTGPGRPAGAPAMRLDVLTEDPAAIAPPAGQVAVRVLNATSAAIDVRTFKSNATSPATPTWDNVAALTASSYVNVDTTGQFNASTLTTQTFNVQDGASAGNLFANVTALQGAKATVDITALPGMRVEGSALTLMVFPRSIAGTAPNLTGAPNFTTPAGSFVWDRRPAYTCSPLC
jgi:hypothetical protein